MFAAIINCGERGTVPKRTGDCPQRIARGTIPKGGKAELLGFAIAGAVGSVGRSILAGQLPEDGTVSTRNRAGFSGLIVISETRNNT